MGFRFIGFAGFFGFWAWDDHKKSYSVDVGESKKQWDSFMRGSYDR